MKAFVSWSGGKETTLSCYRIMQQKDIKVVYLLNMISDDGKHSRSHGIKADMLKLQADAIGIPLIQKRTSWERYENEFIKAVFGLKKKGIEAGIFGDIDIQEHKDWVIRVCKEVDIKPILPLWQNKREELISEFIESGFEAIVIAVKSDLLGKDWLGRHIDKQFIIQLKALDNIDLCGERGEYHTFVYDGPIFRQPLKYKTGKKHQKDNHLFLEILNK